MRWVVDGKQRELVGSVTGGPLIAVRLCMRGRGKKLTRVDFCWEGQKIKKVSLSMDLQFKSV